MKPISDRYIYTQSSPRELIPPPIFTHTASLLYILSCLPSHPAPLTTQSRAHCNLTQTATLLPLFFLTPTPAQSPPCIAQHIHRCNSSSDSDATSQTPLSTITMSPTIDPLYAPVEIHQSLPSAEPILSAGCLTITVLCQFDNTCCCYFSLKDISPDDCVSKIIYNFESSAVQSWVATDETCLSALEFPAFLVELKKKFLPRSWEDELVQDQISMQGSSNFLMWVNTV